MGDYFQSGNNTAPILKLESWKFEGLARVSPLSLRTGQAAARWRRLEFPALVGLSENVSRLRRWMTFTAGRRGINRAPRNSKNMCVDYFGGLK
jgi:hypothetical protein